MRLLEFLSPQRINFLVVPDRLLTNDGAAEMVRAFHSLYQTPLERLSIKGNKIRMNAKPVISWETWFSSNGVEYILGGPVETAAFLQSKASTCWPRSTIQEADGRPGFAPEKTAAAVLHLAEHYFMSLLTDRRTMAPVPAILEAGKLIQDGDRAVIQVLLVPADKDWYQGAQAAYEKFRAGTMPQRFGFDLKSIGIQTAKIGASIGLEAAAIITELITGEATEPESVEDYDRAMVLREGGLSQATLQKGREDAFDLTVRVAVESQHARRRAISLRALTTAIRALDGDNSLQAETVKPSAIVKFLRAMEMQTAPTWKVNPDYVTPPEAAHLLYLPTGPLQVEFPMVRSVAMREQALTDLLTKGKRIVIGTVIHRGQSWNVGWPVRDHDELCLPRVFTGGMGSGKSTVVANFALGALNAGFSVFVHDVADGRMCDEIRDGLPTSFPEDHIIDLDFGDASRPIPLDWADTAARATGPVANRLAAELAAFLERFSEEAGGRTRRWLKKAAQAVYTKSEATMLDNALMLTSAAFRQEVLTSVKDPMVREAWENFDKMSPAMQNQVGQPVLNRLDYLLDDELLKNLLCQPPLLKPEGQPVIDFRRWADGDARGPYCILLRVPKAILGEAATDAVMTLLNVKEWLAILTRQDQPISCRRPCFACYDEPHQFPSIAGRAREQVVEGRKWRFGMVWSFHSWTQIDRSLASILKAAGPHYLLFSSSKEAWQAMGEEITPYTVEEALELPRYHAIARIHAGGSPVPPFIINAAPPAPPVKDREYLQAECSRRYGRPVEQVESAILERERYLWKAMV